MDEQNKLLKILKEKHFLITEISLICRNSINAPVYVIKTLLNAQLICPLCRVADATPAQPRNPVW